MNRPNIEVILMPTLACNMACSYCYVLEKAVGTMDIGLAKAVIAQITDYNDPCIPTKVYWHGSEPLLAGINFFREICQWTRKSYGMDAVQHHIQTNGTLLNDEWFDLFIEEHITTGVSLDGPREIHDTYRKTHDGRGTFDLIFDNIMSARKKKLFFDVLCVITRRTLGHEDELFDFFYRHKIDFGYEPIVPENEWMERELSITPSEFADFTTRIFDRWLLQPEKRLRMVTPPYDFAMGLMQGRNTSCHFSNSCSSHYIAVSPNGEVHSCILFARHQDLALGNFTKQNLQEILNSQKRKQSLKPRGENISQCRDCRWLSVCQGGCPHRAFITHGDFIHPDMFCEAYQRIFEHVHLRMMSMLNERAKTDTSQAAIESPY